MQISNKSKIVIALSSALIVLLCISGYFIHANDLLHSTSQKKHNELILQQIFQIHSELENLKSNPYEVKALSQVVNNINDLKDSISDSAKISDVKNISSEIGTVKSDLDNKLDAIQKAISTQDDGKEYLDKSALPFIVLSIDVIAGYPFVSVNFNNQILPMSVGDTLAGFRLESADFVLDTAQFVNHNNQYIKINLKSST